MFVHAEIVFNKIITNIIFKLKYGYNLVKKGMKE